MSISDTDDSQRASSLGWVKEEVDRSLDEVRAELETFIDEGETPDRSHLERCQSLVQQVRGTLQMVQVEGATVLTGEMESLIGSLVEDSDTIENTNAAFEALIRAVIQLPDYLEKIQAGQRDVPVILLPLINDLRESHGLDVMDEQALFTPAISGIKPPGEAADTTDADVVATARGLRQKIHLSMLGVFRQREAGSCLQKLKTYFREIQTAAMSEPVRQLYWVAAALAEALGDQGPASEVPINQLLARIDRQTRRIIDEGEEPVAAEPPITLIRQLLYHVASAESDGDMASQVKQSFRLEEYLPSPAELQRLRSELGGPSAKVIETVITGIRLELDRARDLLDIYTRTGEQDKEKLEYMIQAMRNAAGTVAMVGDEGLHQSINEYCRELDDLLHGGGRMDLTGMADFILKADSRLQNIQAGDKQPEQEARTVQVDSAGFREAIHAVVRESSINMSNAKDAISEFAESGYTKRDSLEKASGLLQQAAGGLKIADMGRASDVVYAIRSYVDEELINKQSSPSETDMESLAEAVSSTDYYLEAVIDELPNRDAALDLAEAALDLLGYSPDISSRYASLEDAAEPPLEDDDVVVEVEDDGVELEDLAEELAEEVADEQSAESDAYELDPDEVLIEDDIGEVDTDEAVAEVEEAEADIDEIEIPALVESEEEIAERLASGAQGEIDFEELPAIEAVEEEAEAEVEEVVVDAPQESEEEMLARIEDNLKTGAMEAADTQGLEVVDVESPVEEVELDDSAAIDDSDDTDATDSGAEKEGESTGSSASAVIDDSPLQALSPLGDDFDEEIVDIFLEEAGEVISELQTQFPIWERNVGDKESLATIRRSFHTLKGSGRMVGANLIGEFSWEIENLLNHVIDQSRHANEHVLLVVQKAIEALPAMIEQLQGGPGPEQDVVAISTKARAIVNGDFQEPGGDGTEESEEEAARQRMLPETRLMTTIDTEDSESVISEPTPSRPLYTEEIRVVYVEETANHIDTLKNYLAQCRASETGCLLQPEQMRAIHTLHGGAATVGADPLKIIFDFLEPLTVIYEACGIPADSEMLALYERVINQVESFIAEINGEEAVFRQDEELVETLKKLLADAEMKYVNEDGSYKVPDTGVISDDERALQEIESSLESLHDIMSEDVSSLPASGEPSSEDSTSRQPAIDDETEIRIESGSIEDDEQEPVDEEMMEIFLEEAGELLGSIENGLNDWQQEMDDVSIMQTIQRDMHTLKGGARMVNQNVIADISHAMETLLESITEGRIAAADHMFGVLHQALDYLHDVYEGIRADSGHSAGPRPDIVDRINALSRGQMTGDIDEAPSNKPKSSIADGEEEPSYSYDLLEIFLDEAKDILLAIDQSLHEWHQDQENRELLTSILRDIHTLKGGARMVNQNAMGDLSHAMETLLEHVKSGKVVPDEDLFHKLYEAKDQLQDLFEGLKEGDLRQPGRPEQVSSLQSVWQAVSGDLSDVSESLHAGDTGSFSLYEKEEHTPSESQTAYVSDETPSGPMEAIDEEKTPSQAMPSIRAGQKQPHSERRRRPRDEQAGTIRVRSDLIDGLVNLAGETNIFRSRLEQQSNTFRFSLGELDQTVTRLRDQLKKLEIETEAQILFRHETEIDNPENESFDPLEMDRYSQLQQLSRSLVESVGDLDSLQDMLGGLTRESELLLVQQGRVNTELQGRLMQARVVPFAASVASRMRRIIRQTCQQLGKKAELRINGANEEMDRSVLERLIAPLEHMLRNAIAHGIELPEIRKQRGKEETGTVTVSVSREGGEIVVQVADDGAGLDVNVIRAKAIEKDMIAENADMNDDDIMQLVLQPGFSTAENVSQIAGRGVGMDVVHSEIKQLGGSLHIESVFERGAAMTIRLPFTLAINQALLVQVAGDLYAIPLNSIEGVARVEHDEVEELLSSDSDGQYSYGGDKYQVNRLGSTLGMTATTRNEMLRPAVIMVRAGGHRIAFVVDALIGHSEIVVKSLGAQISAVNGLAGGTILGDGRVALILDIPALVRMVAAEHGLSETRQMEIIESPRQAGVTVMVVDDSITVRRVTTRLLERHDMHVLTAKDGVEAVALLEDNIPDVMLLDVEMPRMDGFEVASHMRNDSRFKDVPILMITSRTGEKHRERARMIGVDRYLGKPYQEADLLTNISEVLEDRR